jgi:subtilisin family serine protease
MAIRRVIVEMSHSASLEVMAVAAMTNVGQTLEDTSVLPNIEGVEFDPTFAPVPLPVPQAVPIDEATGLLTTANNYYAVANTRLDVNLTVGNYIVRAVVDEDKIDNLRAANNVVEVYADVEIQPCLICPGSPPLGTAADVERLLCTAALHRSGMDGSGVLVAIVDTGVNMAYLNSKGKNPTFDAARSWVPRAGLVPGSLPVGHGTMCAYDVCIAAPKCTLLDIALLQSSQPGFLAFLSDAIRAYRHLIDVMNAPRRPGDLRSLVVNNSWGMFHPSWDLPIGNPGNYSHNPNHPFNIIVGELEQAGADILFAAGNCGADCPDGRCQGVTTRPIYGANSHPKVLSVAGVDTTKARVGYSSIGPGSLTNNKPDISGYTHFSGSGVYAADGGTSAACPVVAGVVAAVRTVRPYNPGNASTHPAAIRNLMTSTAQDLGVAGYDFMTGYGVVNGCLLQSRLTPPIVIDPMRNICLRYPWLCRDRSYICRRFPWLCEGRPRIPRIPPIPEPDPIRNPIDPIRDPIRDRVRPGSMVDFSDEDVLGEMAEMGEEDLIEAAYLQGYLQAMEEMGETPTLHEQGHRPKKSGCGCGCGCNCGCGKSRR